MTRRRAPKVWIAIGLSVAATTAWAAGPVSLRYRFQAGQKRVYHLVLDQTVELAAAAQGPRKMKTSLEMDTYQKVLAPRPDGARLEIGFARVAATAELDGRHLPVPGLEALDRLKMELTRSDRGQTSDIRLEDADALDPPARRIARQVKSSLVQSSLVLPAGPLAAGQTWTVAEKVPANLGPAGDELLMDVERTYRFIGLASRGGRPAAQIETRLKLSLHGKSVQMGIPVQADLEGGGQGLAWFLVDEGCLLESRAELRIQGRISGEVQGEKTSTGLDIGLKVDMKLK